MSQQSSMSVARLFLEKAPTSGVQDLTPMKILKLTYLAHGWHLCYTDSPLILDQVQAWKYGPVVPSVYHYFKLTLNDLDQVRSPKKNLGSCRHFKETTTLRLS
jgi:uncharacterized phage-associated protein